MSFTRTEKSGGYYGTNYNEEWFIKKVYPNATILPYFRKRGVNILSAGPLQLDLYLQKVDKEPFAETLVKAKNYYLANRILWGDHIFQRFLPSVKIALRNGFNFEQLHRLGDYEDYLRELEYIGMDIHSPKYLCPSDFKAEHARVSRLANRKREIERKKRERENAKRFRAELAERTRPYASLVIQGFGLEIRILTTPEQYLDEGEAMHHCVGSYVGSDFHKASIIFSARMNGERVETIEIDTEKWIIVQSCAVCNGFSDHHDNIINLMKKNMPRLKRLSKAS